jgi:enterochelin esterase family protein
MTKSVREVFSVLLVTLVAVLWAFSGQTPATPVSAADPTSARIAALQKRVEGGDAAAISEFWDAMKKEGTPIVEKVEGDPKNLIVTFVWRGGEDVRNVVVFAGLKANEPLRNRMNRLGQTDLWFKTYLIPSNARFSYLLSVNDSLKSLDEVEKAEIGGRVGTFRLDPLNRRGAVGSGSGVELPDAPPQPWTTRQPDVPQGKLEPATIRSTILNNERRAWVYTPPGYNSTAKPFSFILMLDGPMYTLLIPSPTILDNLLAKGEFPPAIAFILDNPTPTSRETEFACNDSFADFISKEAIPWLRSRYNVTSEPSQTYIVGVSFGGLAASFVALRHPEIFGNVISQSGSYWFAREGDREPGWLMRQFATGVKLPLKFHLDVGLMERGGTPGGGPDMVAVNRHFRDVLRAKGYEVDYREYFGGHEPINWRGMLPEALIALRPKR